MSKTAKNYTETHKNVSLNLEIDVMESVRKLAVKEGRSASAQTNRMLKKALNNKQYH